MMDIDHFKAINDTHGHAAGDEVLKALVAKCISDLREVDFVGSRIFGRLGGEEFAVILVDCNLTGALVTAERLRQKLAELEVETPSGTLKFTVSIGANEWQPIEETLEAALARADKALYAAKDGGRNRVVGEPG